ncbi:MAG: hypothetical protein KAT17_06275 [Candidatus Aminicenantes bacterium]|nr:hypothetical protein [Candidatus Aminicenantes bacterium]
MRLLFILILLAQQFLLRQPIQQAIETNNFSYLEMICQDKVSINFEEPFLLNGYFSRSKFIDAFSRQFSRFEVKKFEWLTRQIEEKFAIQSLNLILKNRRSEKLVYYKFIFFMTQDKTWKLYYIRGLRI